MKILTGKKARSLRIAVGNLYFIDACAQAMAIMGSKKGGRDYRERTAKIIQECVIESIRLINEAIK